MKDETLGLIIEYIADGLILILPFCVILITRWVYLT